MDIKRIEAAIEYKNNGYNCCHALLLAYEDLLDIDRETLTHLGAGFGSGMGCMEATCGALCGAQMVAGLLQNQSKISHIAKEVYKNFDKKCGATICKELKGVETGKLLCSCNDCVRNAVIALSETLKLEKS